MRLFCYTAQNKNKMKNRTYIKDLKAFGEANLGGEATIAGWVSVRRDQGKLIFFDFRDSQKRKVNSYL